MKTEAKERMFLILAPHWLCLFYIEKGQSFMLMQIAMQKVTNRRAKSYFSVSKKLLFEARKATFCVGLRAPAGCGAHAKASHSRATCSGCTLDGRCPSSCVLTSIAAASHRTAYKSFLHSSSFFYFNHRGTEHTEFLFWHGSHGSHSERHGFLNSVPLSLCGELK